MQLKKNIAETRTATFYYILAGVHVHCCATVCVWPRVGIRWVQRRLSPMDIYHAHDIFCYFSYSLVHFFFIVIAHWLVVFGNRLRQTERTHFIFVHFFSFAHSSFLHLHVVAAIQSNISSLRFAGFFIVPFSVSFSLSLSLTRSKSSLSIVFFLSFVNTISLRFYWILVCESRVHNVHAFLLFRFGCYTLLR